MLVPIHSIGITALISSRGMKTWELITQVCDISIRVELPILHVFAIVCVVIPFSKWILIPRGSRRPEQTGLSLRGVHDTLQSPSGGMEVTQSWAIMWNVEVRLCIPVRISTQGTRSRQMYCTISPARPIQVTEAQLCKCASRICCIYVQVIRGLYKVRVELLEYKA